MPAFPGFNRSGAGSATLYLDATHKLDIVVDSSGNVTLTPSGSTVSAPVYLATTKVTTPLIDGNTSFNGDITFKTGSNTIGTLVGSGDAGTFTFGYAGLALTKAVINGGIAGGASTVTLYNQSGIAKAVLSSDGTLSLTAAQGKDASGSNTVADNLIIKPGVSTGNATPASVVIQSTIAGSSGSTAQTLSDTVTITNGQVTVDGASAKGTFNLIGATGGDFRISQGPAIANGYISLTFTTPKLGLTRNGDHFLWYDTTNGDLVLNNTFGGSSGLKLAYGGTAAVTLSSATALGLTDAVNLSVGTTTGTKIGTATTQKLGFWNATPVVRPSAYTPTNVTTDRSYDANATTLDEVADVLGTLIADLQSIGLLG